MIQIRPNIFETNSSSVHALVFISDNEYNGLVNGTMFFDFDEQTMVSLEEAMNETNYTSELDFRNHVVDKHTYYSFEGINRLQDCSANRYPLPDGGHANIINLDYYC